jgi:glutathione S-transferase
VGAETVVSRTSHSREDPEIADSVAHGVQDNGCAASPMLWEWKMKLYYSHNLNPRVAVAVALYLRSPVEFIRASPRNGSATEEAFRSINPNALVPVLVEGQARIWETDAIACRLSSVAGSDFWPTGEAMPELIMWLSWSAHHFTEAGSAFYFENIIRPKYLGEPADQTILARAGENFHRFARVLDEILASRDWLMQERMTFADFRVATVLPFAEAAALPIANYGNICSWQDRLNLVDAWRSPFEGLS